MLPEIQEKITLLGRTPRARCKGCIRVCTAAGCQVEHSLDIKQALEAEVEARGLTEEIEIKGVGCMGLCSAAPLISIAPDDVLYKGATVNDVAAIIESVGHETLSALECPSNIPFFRRQQRIVLENCGVIDPLQIEDYLAAGGYEALVNALLTMTPDEVAHEVSVSKLRGRGGAGYPTGLKWAAVAKSDRFPKYVICNADEGDPGAFMDRTVLESDPHRVLEGMALAAYAVGADHGYIYIRGEYPLAIETLRVAISQAEELGFLGHNIFDTDFSFKIQLRIGAGAYVCGEETALIASIEGQRGTPRVRPPYPSDHGLWGCPTVINNVETFANIAPIIRNGGDWFASIGTPKSTGTKVFSLAGQVKNNGVIEVPMGITLREVIFDIGGGVPGGKRIKAVQTGGPTGGCIPESLLDTPVDYDALVKLGSMMGSGGMIVLDESTCMVDLARYFMSFCMAESCGKCVPCRVGTAEMHDLLTKIAGGTATNDDLTMLEYLAMFVKRCSLCGLGQGAPTPILSTLRYFRDEYLQHINEHICQSGICVPAEREVVTA